MHSRLHREREATRKQRASRRKEEENQGRDVRCRDRGIQNASDSLVTFRTNARRSHLLQHCHSFFSPQTSNQSFNRRQNKELLTKLCFVKRSCTNLQLLWAKKNTSHLWSTQTKLHLSVFVFVKPVKLVNPLSF